MLQNLSMRKTCAKTDSSRATIYRAIARNEFPQPIRFGRRIFFVESEIDEWIDARMKARDGGAQ